VVVTGASGGLAMAAIQIARHSGARVIAVTTSSGKVERLKAVGADEVIVSGDGTFGEEVRRLTGGVGAELEVEWEIHGVQSASRDDLHEILHFMHRTGLTPTIWKTMPLDQATEAHRQLANREAVGRIIVTL
jgi:NADPH:quinone reductase-like Zn-dependent oxidoreductase